MPSADVGATRARSIDWIRERFRPLGGPAGRLARAGIMGLVPLLAGGGGLAAAEPTRSGYIADVQIDQGTIRKFADESDNFHLTWHPNGSLYGAYGDGWGFMRSAIDKQVIGVSRINGTPPSLTGSETWEGDAQGGSCCWSSWNGKTWGMIAIGAKLHMWFTVGRPRALGFTEARIATSSDNGATWSKAGWAFTTFMQVGQGYQSGKLSAEIMNYAYSFHTQYVKHPANVQSPGRVLLMRSPKGEVQTRSSYEFFAGTTSSGAPIWTKEVGKRQPVLEKPHILDVAPAVAWNPHLNRFIMVMGHVPAWATAKRGVGFYEAEKPWGPWYRIKEIDQFTEGTIFFYQFPTKWMSADLSAWMAFTGTDKAGGQEWDALDVVKVRFVLADATAAPTAANDTATTDAGKPVTIAVLANDKGTGLTIPSVTTPANGTARINTDRTITYTPDAGYAGSDSFRYTIKDADDRTASAQITITVRPVAEPIYLGCYLDKIARDLVGLRTDDMTGMTVAKCASICTRAGFGFSAVQAGYACFCDDSYGSYGPASNCNLPCPGDSSKICGRHWANGVYRLP